MSAFLDFNTDFTPFSTQHVTVIALIILCSIGLPWLAKRHFIQRQNLWLSRLMAASISAWVVLYDVILLYQGKFNYQTDIPLDICNMMGLVLPFVMWTPNKRFFPYLYFWILTGTIQAVLSPHLFNGFPNFIFIKYWVVHGGLIIYILFIAAAWDFQLKWRHLWKAFWGLQVYVLFIYVTNKIIGANYVYVIEKPPTASILDYFGAWPFYILVCEVIYLLLSVFVFLPYLQSVKEESAS